MNTFKFRAEADVDVRHLWSVLVVSVERIYCIFKKPSGIEVEITLDCEIETLKNMMKLVPDSHVMLQTVAPLMEYTGIRRYP